MYIVFIIDRDKDSIDIETETELHVGDCFYIAGDYSKIGRNERTIEGVVVSRQVFIDSGQIGYNTKLTYDSDYDGTLNLLILKIS